MKYRRSRPMRKSRKAPRKDRAASRKDRSASRKDRSASRKGRSASRKNRRVSRRQSGGWVVMNPAGVADNSMAASSKLSLAQGGQYGEAHKGQHGGGAPLEGAPVGTTGVLDSSMRVAAHLGPLDRSYDAIKGMSDQSGGGKRKDRKASRKDRKASRKGRKASRKGRKASRRSAYRFGNLTRSLMRMFKRRSGSRRSRSQRGGAALNPADYSSPGTLLPASLANKAVMQMNPEWKLAENPASFAPKA